MYACMYAVSTLPLTFACHARALISFILFRLPLVSFQCERTLSKSIGIICTFRKRLHASPPSRHAALRASRVRIRGVADLDLAVEKHKRLLVDILEGFQAKPLTLVARAGMELKCVVYVHWASVGRKFHCDVLPLFNSQESPTLVKNFLISCWKCLQNKQRHVKVLLIDR